MLRRIPIIIAIGLCTHIVTQYALATDEQASQLKQAEELAKNKQYDQAEQIYLAIAAQDIPEAFTAQKSLIFLYITTNKLSQADAAYQQLLARFSQHKGIAEALWKIGIAYNQAANSDKAIEVHQYNIEHFPDDVNAVFSQVEIVKSYLGRGDEAAADASVSNFLTVYSGQPTLPKGIYHVARRYDEFKKPDKAIELHQYNVEHFPEDTYALWSQAEIIFSYIRDGKDPEADSAFNNLLTVFANQPTLSHEIYQVARRYSKVGKTEKALSIHQYNVDHFPKSIHAMWSQVEIVFAYIRDGNEPAADAAFDKLVSTFSDQPTLSKEVYEVAKKFSEAGNNEKAQHLYQYLIGRWATAGDIDSRAFVVTSHIALGNEQEAQAQLNKLMADFTTHSKLTEAIHIVAQVYYDRALSEEARESKELARENLAKAITIWAKIINELPASEPDTPRAYYCSAVCYSQELGEHAKSLEYFRSIVDKWPNYTYAWHAQFFIGQCYERLKKSGLISASLADPEIERAYLAVIERYPESKSAGPAALAKESLGMFPQTRFENVVT